MNYIEIIGAKVHNLKNINLKIPKNLIIAITGVSGSGKSSLAFDLLFEEGRNRYLHAIGMPPRLEKEKLFDLITGLSPTIAVQQRTIRYINPRSTVGTRTGIYNYLRMLYAIEGIQNCPICKEPLGSDNACPICGMTQLHLEVKHFSFNEPSGMCLSCKGKGYKHEFRKERIIPDPTKPLLKICADASGCFADMKGWIPSLSQHYEFDIDTPFTQLSPKIQEIFLYGSKEKIALNFKSKEYEHKTQKIFEGVIPHLERALEQSTGELRRKKIEENYMDIVLCPSCQGFRINEQARNVFLGEKHIGECANFSILELITFLEQLLKKQKFRTVEGKTIISKIIEELKKFDLLGISYLHLNRNTRTLSGGENQRLSLMSHLSLGLEHCILILDEPTMGMHEIEKKNLGNFLQQLRDAGNSIIIVEHDENMIKLADQIIDLGPGAGIEGGKVVFQGTFAEIAQCSDSLTGQYLFQKLSYPFKEETQRKTWILEKSLKLNNITTNNLKNISISIPLGIMVGISGVSGSGKSSLITKTLVPLIQKILKTKNQKNTNEMDQLHQDNENNDIDENQQDPLTLISGILSGSELIEDCIVVDQQPIGRSSNSFPASYIGLWDYIRKLFSKQELAKKRKYQEGHFSFNSDKGRCPKCKGEGKISLSVSFLDEIQVTCEECEGKRYLPEILEVTYQNKTIREILDLSVKDALKVFKNEPKITHYLKILEDIGMGYITLGQPATTLSGGESQRIKLAKSLGSMRNTQTLFILDEPTTGLHFHDEVKLLNLLDQLVQQGNSIIIIEHNSKVLNYCDWLIELGPIGGPQGGYIIAEGTPETLKKSSKSQIGPFLK